MKVACWNVHTLLDKELSERPHRRTALLARELSLYDIDIAIAGLSEAHLADVGQLTETGSGYTFIWKGKPADEAREHGLGFAIKSSLSKNLQELLFGSLERIISLRLHLRQKRFVTIVSVYAPTMDSSQTNILSFYDVLRKLFLNICDNDKIILLGDLNARVGRDSQTWKYLGLHGLGKPNSNGLQLFQFCNGDDLIIGNTWFRKKTTTKKKTKHKYKGTWKHPRSRHWHMINYVIVRRHDLEDLTHVRAMRGAECWTDHRLVRAKIELKIRSKVRHTTSPRVKKLEVSKFSHLPETKNIFSECTIELDETNLWEDFKVKVLSAAQDIFGFQKRKCQVCGKL